MMPMVLLSYFTVSLKNKQYLKTWIDQNYLFRITLSRWINKKKALFSKGTFSEEPTLHSINPCYFLASYSSTHFKETDVENRTVDQTKGFPASPVSAALWLWLLWHSTLVVLGLALFWTYLFSSVVGRPWCLPLQSTLLPGEALCSLLSENDKRK